MVKSNSLHRWFKLNLNAIFNILILKTNYLYRITPKLLLIIFFVNLYSCDTYNSVQKITDPVKKDVFYQWNGIIWTHAQIPSQKRKLQMSVRKDHKNSEFIEFEFETVYPIDKPAFDSFCYWVYDDKIAKFDLKKLRNDVVLETYSRYIDDDGRFYQQADPARDLVSSHFIMNVPVEIVKEACQHKKSNLKFYSENGRIIWSVQLQYYHTKPWLKLANNQFSTSRY
jgi:hypothetical protein